MIFEDLLPVEYSDAYFGLLASLERVLQSPVDLVKWEAIKPPYFLQALEDSRVQLYAALRSRSISRTSELLAGA